MHTQEKDERHPQVTRGNSDPYKCYRRYFAEFLPGIVGQLMMEDLRSLSCQVEIEVTDSGDAPWRLAVKDGRLTQIDHEGPEPQCRYVLDLNTLIDVVTAQCSLQDAFFDMRIEIEGDIERGLELSSVLGAFFERFPFRPQMGA